MQEAEGKAAAEELAGVGKEKFPAMKRETSAAEDLRGGAEGVKMPPPCAARCWSSCKVNSPFAQAGVKMGVSDGLSQT